MVRRRLWRDVAELERMLVASWGDDDREGSAGWHAGTWPTEAYWPSSYSSRGMLDAGGQQRFVQSVFDELATRRSLRAIATEVRLLQQLIAPGVWAQAVHGTATERGVLAAQWLVRRAPDLGAWWVRFLASPAAHEAHRGLTPALEQLDVILAAEERHPGWAALVAQAVPSWGPIAADIAALQTGIVPAGLAAWLTGLTLEVLGTRSGRARVGAARPRAELAQAAIQLCGQPQSRLLQQLLAARVLDLESQPQATWSWCERLLIAGIQQTTLYAQQTAIAVIQPWLDGAQGPEAAAGLAAIAFELLSGEQQGRTSRRAAAMACAVLQRARELGWTLDAREAARVRLIAELALPGRRSTGDEEYDGLPWTGLSVSSLWSALLASGLTTELPDLVPRVVLVGADDPEVFAWLLTHHGEHPDVIAAAADRLPGRRTMDGEDGVVARVAMASWWSWTLGAQAGLLGCIPPVMAAAAPEMVRAIVRGWLLDASPEMRRAAMATLGRIGHALGAAGAADLGAIATTAAGEAA